MADLNKIVDDLSALTVLEAAELAKMLEEKSGVSADPLLAVAGLTALVTALGLSHSAMRASQPSRIAVLPFRALDGVEPELAEGMADEVLSDLSQHDGLQTVGRTSSWMFKDKAEDLRKVGKKLDVQYVVEGSVR